jgi:hypothetical protein
MSQQKATQMNDEREKLSVRIIQWSIALTTTFAAVIVVLALLQSVYLSVGIRFEPWFVRKLTAEIFFGVIMQLASLLSGVLFALGKSIVSVRREEPLLFISQAVFFLIGSGAFLLFSIEMFRSVMIP